MSIEREDHGEVAVLRMSRGKVNALDLELLAALCAALDRAEESAGAVVLTGAGPAFSAGVDLFRIVDGGPGYIREFLALLSETLRRLFTFPRPTVAAVNGHAIAGGHLLMAACDRTLLARGGARVGVTELQVGVPFPTIALEILRSSAPSALQDLAYTGRLLGAEEALARGVVHELVAAEELLARAEADARRLAAVPRAAYGLTKKMIVLPALDRAARLEAELGAEIEAAWLAPEAARVIRAFLDRTVGKRG